MGEEDTLLFDASFLDPLAALLTPEAVALVRTQLRRLQGAPPPVSGSGMDPIEFIPGNLTTCQEKLRLVLARLRWLRQLAFLQGLSERQARQAMGSLRKDQAQLQAENRQLQQEVERLGQRRRTLLGIKDESTCEHSPEESLGAGEPAQPGRCPHCQQRCYAPEAEVGPSVRTGANLAALLAAMRHTLGASYRKLSRFSTDVCHIALTPSAVWGIIQRLSTRLEPLYSALESMLPQQPALHADETGWRMDGERWQLWCFCNDNLALFHADRSRASAVATERLGNDFQGLLHSDFYSAYHCFPNTQKCLTHFLRDVRDELKIVPEDSALLGLRQTLKDCIEHGKRLQAMAPGTVRDDGIQTLEAKLDACTALTSEHPRTQTLLARVTKHRTRLIAFIHHPQGQPTNNRAEQRIRPAVIFRKLSFGNRSEQGARNFSILCSVLETYRIKSDDEIGFLRTVLTTPSEDIAHLARRFLSAVFPAAP